MIVNDLKRKYSGVSVKLFIGGKRFLQPMNMRISFRWFPFWKEILIRRLANGYFSFFCDRIFIIIGIGLTRSLFNWLKPNLGSDFLSDSRAVFFLVLPINDLEKVVRQTFLLVLQEIIQKKKGEERERADQSWQSKKTALSNFFLKLKVTRRENQEGD
jgi:hypothetical protein